MVNKKMIELNAPLNANKNRLCVTIYLGRICQHTQDINARVQSRLNASKARPWTSSRLWNCLWGPCAKFVRPIFLYASPVWHPDLTQSYMQGVQRRNLHSAHRHAETKVFYLRGTQIVYAAVAPEYSVHEGLHNPLVTRRYTYNA